jgi:aspartyl-tRNA(Asn)/glutamyl-tRNA(Gln) amidotransferase subunit A
MMDITGLSLRDVAARLRDGRLSARELAEAALSSMRLGAYVQTEPGLTRDRANAADAAFRARRDLGPLQGVPVSMKDLFGVPGFLTRAGTPSPLPERFERPGPVVAEVLRQHAVITGKTHTVELAFGGIGTNPHYPTPVNPWDAAERRAPGGSSSGAGASLCEGSALLALGTDTAGSVRIPASWTGNAALKTTKGRWSTEGIVPLSPTLDTPGIMARTVEDLCLAYEALDPDGTGIAELPDLPDLTIGRCDDLFFDDCSPGVAEAVESALSELASAGARMVSIDLPELRPTFELFKAGGPVSVELCHFLSRELPDRLETLDPNVRSRIGDSVRITALEYLDRMKALSARAASAAGRLGGTVVLACPTVANTPPRLADVSTPETYRAQNVLCLRNTAMVSYLGFCAVTLPVGLDAAGMPVGLQLVARGRHEPRLLAAARRVELRLGKVLPRQRAERLV